MSARDNAAGQTAGIQADDAALPKPTVIANRFGPSLTTQPLPGTNSGLEWKLAARPAAHREVTLSLTNVAALTVDTAAAKLPTGTITVTTDGTARLTLAHLRAGTQVLEGGRRVATAGANGAASVRLASGTTALVLG